MADAMSNPALPERTGDYSERPSMADPTAEMASLAKRLKPYIDNPYIAPSHTLLTEIYKALVGR